ncbi:MAG TPA: IS110 family transposase [Cellvibrionaceae bacterium]
MVKHNLISVDLAKNVFQVCSMSRQQKVTFNKSIRRKELSEFMANQPPVEVAMEACYSSHYWARRFQTMGHTVRLLPAQHVSPFVRGNKSDHNDAVAIAEASRRPNILSVPIKSVEQQDIQCLHRIRDRYIAQRTALMNQTRGLLSEYGIISPKGHNAFCQLLREITQPDFQDLSPILKTQLHQIVDEYYGQTDRIGEITRTLTAIANKHPLCRLMLTIPGIGPINATAIYSAIGNGSQFKSGREFSVWLGLTPRQASSGNSFKSGGITKRGNRYLRKQLVHGARAVLFRCRNKTDQLSRWGNQLVDRRGIQKACVAMAARLARLIWVLLQRQEVYKPMV